MTTGELMKKRRKELGYTADYIAEQLKVSRSTIFRYEKGEIEKVPSEFLEPLAQVLHTTPAYLMGWTDEVNDKLEFDNIFPIETKKFPLLGEIACGEPIFAEENFESYVEANAKIRADFCLKCKGDSMINARIHDGDIVFIKKQSIVENGQIAAVIIDNEATLKRVYYYPEEAKLILNAENPAYPPYVYIGNELDQVRILGLAVAFQSDVR